MDMGKSDELEDMAWQLIVFSSDKDPCSMSSTVSLPTAQNAATAREWDLSRRPFYAILIRQYVGSSCLQIL
jgi:hypothetical protein